MLHEEIWWLSPCIGVIQNGQIPKAEASSGGVHLEHDIELLCLECLACVRLLPRLQHCVEDSRDHTLTFLTRRDAPGCLIQPHIPVITSIPSKVPTHPPATPLDSFGPPDLSHLCLRRLTLRNRLPDVKCHSVFGCNWVSLAARLRSHQLRLLVGGRAGEIDR